MFRMWTRHTAGRDPLPRLCSESLEQHNYHYCSGCETFCLGRPLAYVGGKAACSWRCYSTLLSQQRPEPVTKEELIAAAIVMGAAFWRLRG